MATSEKTKKRKLTKTLKSKPSKKLKSKKPSSSSSSSSSESDPEKLSNLLQPYSKDQLIDLIANSSLQNPNLLQYLRDVADRDPVHRKLFIHGLSWDTTRETLISFFQTFGEIEECNVVTDKATGKSKGYAFLVFKSRSSASKALKEPKRTINNRVIYCQLASVGAGSGPKESNLGKKGNEGKLVVAGDVKGKNLVTGSYGAGSRPQQQQQQQQEVDALQVAAAAQAQMLAAVAAAQNMALFGQNPVYGGFFNPAVLGQGLGMGGSASQVNSSSSGGLGVGAYSGLGTGQTTQGVQYSYVNKSQSGQQQSSSGGKKGGYSGQPSYRWYDLGLLAFVYAIWNCADLLFITFAWFIIAAISVDDASVMQKTFSSVVITVWYM